MSGMSARKAEAASEEARRKRLGQYFTGLPLARLLASLARAQSVTAAIDPFMGSGDMLAALGAFGSPRMIAGIEIDPPALVTARERLTGSAECVALVAGDSFNPASLRQLPRTSFDLVITNPPYVRYQSMARAGTGDIILPDAVRVRTGLIEMLRTPDLFPHLDKADRDLLVRLASGYSGLADLAVPSWILSAALTSVGGKLAMVVPESWLSRDYAQTVHYLLLRWFRIQHIVEDAHAAWFSNALVRTTLLIAERVPRRPSAFAWDSETFLKTSVRACAGSDTSVVGAAFLGSEDADAAFAATLEEAAEAHCASSNTFWEAHRVPLAEKSSNLRAASAREPWLAAVEPNAVEDAGVARVSPAFLPDPVRRWLGGDRGGDFACLGDLGFEVGQGLRTGANDFFYVDLLSAERLAAKVRTAGKIEQVSDVPLECLLPVIRWQEELDGTFGLDAGRLSGRVLVFDAHALPEDRDDPILPPALREASLVAYKPMPHDLADYVRLVALGKIPGMSAVRPNVRAGKQGKPGRPTSPPRWWYMLPKLATRHRPDILIGRVNNKVPRAILNPGRQCVVDANFSSIWEVTPQGRAPAMLALLNSAWAGAVLECMGAVMGGGALKVEAAHLARMPLPRLDAPMWRHLGELGTKLASGEAIAETRDAIDAAVAGAVTGDKSIERVNALKAIRDQHQRKRCHKI